MSIPTPKVEGPMQGQSLPLLRDLVLVGGGHAHALVLRLWAMKPLAGVRLTVINPDAAAPYTGMLPGLVAGHYTPPEMMIDLVRLARFAGARLILDHVTGMDRAGRRLHLAGRPPMDYDIASLDIGITSDLGALPGAEAALAVKPLGTFADRWQRFVDGAQADPHLVIIGAGVGGVELALAQAHRLRHLRPRITVVDKAAVPLPGLGRAARAALLAELDGAGITLILNAAVERLSPDAVWLADGRRLSSDLTLSAAGARPHRWLADIGLHLTDGFVTVGADLRSSDPAIFAAGDCAHLSHAPRPKAGVFAVRQAPVLLHNLRAALTGTALRGYQPQRDYLKLISMGDRRAVADKFGLRTGGAWLWQWKDRIDRRFMAKFAAYPAPRPQALPDPAIPGLADLLSAQPLCAGCGSKIAPRGLSQVLAGLPLPQRADVLSGAGDDAAVLRHGDGVQVITTDHLRAFSPDARLMARIAATHALGDIWAMGAMPQVALAQIVLPRLSDRLQTAMLAEIMQAATEVFAAAGAEIVGGHTSTGAELTIGFTVTGIAARAIGKAGAHPGDVLILTKPLGSGTVMAAEMAMTLVPGLILGPAVAAANRIMTQPSGAASALLAPVAHAMTDVTGFGLAGHLLECLDASGCAATVSLASLPMMPGAEALAAAGVASSLAPANRAATLGRVTGPITAPTVTAPTATAPTALLYDTARTALLYDPQTGGGLLAAVPADRADGVLADLLAAGCQAAIIGRVEAGPVRLILTD